MPQDLAPPTITVMIPMRNEEASIVACLNAASANVLPEGMTAEILVLDGQSTDRSVELVLQLAKTDPRIRLIENPKRLQAAAFNLALSEARGEFFVRLDAHSLYAPDYIASCINLLQETGAENVGGVVLARGSNFFGEAVAAAVSSKFAVGDAQYRVATKPGWVDTIFPGAWRTATLRKLGGMREDWLVNEDYELNSRLRAAGGKIYLSPDIRPIYFVRGSVTSLARQYYRYGFWKIRTLLEHPKTLRWRQLVAPAFVLSILATPITYKLLGKIGLLHIFLYAIASFVASIAVARKSRLALLPFLPLVFLIVHLAWGTGFLLGLCYWPGYRSQHSSGRRRGILALLSIAGLIGYWAIIAVLGDRIWWTTPLLFGPRWVAGAFFLGILPLLLTQPKRALIPMLVGAALFAFAIMGVRPGLGRLVPHAGTPVRVMEFNVAGGGSAERIKSTLDFINAEKPALIFVAECGNVFASALQQSLKEYQLQTAADVCLFSTFPIHDWEGRDPTEFRNVGGSGGIARGVVVTPAGEVRIGVVHLATPRHSLVGYLDMSSIPTLGPETQRNIALRDRESSAAREWILQGDSIPTIIAGDFNLPVESAIYRRYWNDFGNSLSLAGAGLVHTKITHWWGIRIDHVLTRNRIATQHAWVGPDLGSDHLPVIADLVITRP